MPEQRKYTRYNAPDDTLALACGGMSKIINISKSGLCLMFLEDMKVDIPKKLSLDLLSTDNIIKARKIPGELAWEHVVSISTISGMVYKKVGVQFAYLSDEQKDQLDKLIMNYTSEST